MYHPTTTSDPTRTRVGMWTQISQMGVVRGLTGPDKGLSVVKFERNSTRLCGWRSRARRVTRRVDDRSRGHARSQPAALAASDILPASDLAVSRDEQKIQDGAPGPENRILLPLPIHLRTPSVTLPLLPRPSKRPQDGRISPRTHPRCASLPPQIAPSSIY